MYELAASSVPINAYTEWIESSMSITTTKY